MGGDAKAVPHRLNRGPEGIVAPSGSWRALYVCPCGDPYCWYEIFKVQRLSPWLYCKGLAFAFLETDRHI